MHNCTTSIYRSLQFFKQYIHTCTQTQIYLSLCFLVFSSLLNTDIMYIYNLELWLQTVVANCGCKLVFVLNYLSDYVMHTCILYKIVFLMSPHFFVDVNSLIFLSIGKSIVDNCWLEFITNLSLGFLCINMKTSIYWQKTNHCKNSFNRELVNGF